MCIIIVLNEKTKSTTSFMKKYIACLYEHVWDTYGIAAAYKILYAVILNLLKFKYFKMKCISWHSILMLHIKDIHYKRYIRNWKWKIHYHHLPSEGQCNDFIKITINKKCHTEIMKYI